MDPLHVVLEGLPGDEAVPAGLALVPLVPALVGIIDVGLQALLVLVVLVADVAPLAGHGLFSFDRIHALLVALGLRVSSSKPTQQNSPVFLQFAEENKVMLMPA